jgi:hypothetical protein
MESMRIDDNIKRKPPILPKGYKLEESVEGELLLLLVSDEPDKRPSIQAICTYWLPKWEQSLKKTD